MSIKCQKGKTETIDTTKSYEIKKTDDSLYSFTIKGLIIKKTSGIFKNNKFRQPPLLEFFKDACNPNSGSRIQDQLY